MSTDKIEENPEEITIKDEANVVGCPVCGSKNNLMRCTGCRDVSYCSPKCHRKHWSVHKKVCRPFKVAQDSIFGKHLRATKDLKAGAVLLEEKPVLYCPSRKQSTLSCLSCGKPFHGPRPRPCSKCFWPICSAACEQVPMHKDNECQVFSSQNMEFGMLYDPNNDNRDWSMKRSFIIECVRGMQLKKFKPKVYQELLSNVFRHPEDYNSEFILNLKKNIKLFKGLINIEEMMGGLEVDEEELLQFRKAVGSNHISAVVSGFNIDGVYLIATRMSHSCSPNCIGISLPMPFARRIVTIRPVQQGEQLTFNYFQPAHLLLSRLERQQEMFTRWNCYCQCDRCIDPTELGSYTDGIICPNCSPTKDSHLISGYNKSPNVENSGYYLPINNQVQSQELVKSNWECSKCKSIKPPNDFRKVTYDLEQKLEQIKHSSREVIVPHLLRFDRACRTFLHPNHSILIKAAQVTIDSFKGLPMGGFIPVHMQSLEECQLFISKAEYLVKITNQVTPGLSILRADLLSQLSSIQYFMIEHYSSSFTDHEKLATLQSALANIDESIACTVLYPPASELKYLLEANPIFKSQIVHTMKKVTDGLK